MSYDEQAFAKAIDAILRKSDLNTISAKRIRKVLSAQFGHDIGEHKASVRPPASHNFVLTLAVQSAINTLIEKRFDKIHDEAVQEPNAASDHAANGASSPLTSARSSPAKRGADESEMSDVVDSPKPKKQKLVRKGAEDNDAAFAARLQAEENSRARPTRGGAVTKKKAPIKRKKVKSAPKVKENGELESGTDAEPQRKGGFHVCRHNFAQTI